MAVTQRLADWVAETPPIRDETAVHLARQGIVDGVACMLAGADDPAAAAVRRTAGRWGSGACTVVGHGGRLAAPWAALVNGTSAHALDYDDNYMPATTHATAVALPALLAVAEERRLGGPALIDAYIVALEIQARVGQGVNLTHYRKGWHATATVGTIGTAAGAARLLGLDAAGVRNALSLAVSMAAGPKKQFGTLTKPVHAGLGAKNAVLAAQLAADGMQAHAEPLDGDWGFRELYAGPDSPGYDAALASLGDPLAIVEFGLAPKIHPCCGATHRSIDGVLELRAAHGLAPEMVERIETVVPDTNYRNLMYPEPRDGMEGRFSMHYCLALALLQGEVTVADFQPGAVDRPDVRAWLPRVVMDRHPTAANDPRFREPAVVTITLKDGRALTTSVQHARGTRTRPLGDADYAAKFRDCAARAIPASAADAALDRLWRLDRGGDAGADVGGLMALLAPADGAAAAAD